MGKGMTNLKGFSLVEVVATLTIIGMISAIAGLGMVQMVNGFVFSMENTEAVQTAQMALLRLSKELRSADEITSGNSAEIIWTGHNPVQTFRVYRSGTSLMLETGAGPAILAEGVIDQANSFRLSYLESFDQAVPATSYTAGTEMIEITLVLAGAGDVPMEFSYHVSLQKSE